MAAMHGVLVAVALLVPAAALGTFAWRTCGQYGEVCDRAGLMFPQYDPATGRIALVMHDLSGNGIVDAWAYLKDDRIDAIEIDDNEDGAIDRRLVFDERGVAREVEPLGTESPEAAVDGGPPNR